MELHCPKCGTVSRVDRGMFEAVGLFHCPRCRAPMAEAAPSATPDEPPDQQAVAPPLPAGPWEAPLTASAEQEIPLRFIGTGREYFNIWIVNLTLSILTLGIYSAWAKVRRKRFFYGHTLLETSSFDYLGNPIKILLGRLLLVLLFALLGVVSRFDPTLAESTSNLLVLFLFPLLLVKARAFNLRNSAFRNLRFDFKGGYWRSFQLTILYPILVLLTLGLFMPRWLRAQQAFWVQHSCYGSAFGRFQAENRDFFRLFLRMGGVVVLLILLLSVLGMTVLEHAIQGSGMKANELRNGVTLLLQLGLPLLMLLIYSYYQAALFRLVWNHVGLGEAHFVCRLNPWRMVWITLSNTLLILFSIGLLAPWAKVRAVRYRLESLALVVGGAGLAGFVAARTQEVGAVGEEIGDFFDVDIGL